MYVITSDKRLNIKILYEILVTSVSFLVTSYSKLFPKVKKNQALPRKLLKIILYGYMNKFYSSRNIEKACYRDINFMYLLKGSKRPTYSTFARFRSLHLVLYVLLVKQVISFIV